MINGAFTFYFDGVDCKKASVAASYLLFLCAADS